MKTPFLYLLLFLFPAVNICRAQTQNTDTLILFSGQLAPESLNKPSDSLEVYYFKAYDYRLFERPVIYKTPLTNGSFSLKISSRESGYLSILNLSLLTFYTNLFPVQPGYRMHLESDAKKQFHFTGKDAPAMNYQLELGRLLYAPDTTVHYQISDTTRISYQRERENKLIRAAAELFPLQALTTYSVKGMCLFEMTNFIDSADQIYKNLLRSEISHRLHAELGRPEAEKHQNSNYFTYLFYLTDLNKAAVSLQSGTSRYPFRKGYDFITSHYSGLLRDRLLLIYFGLRKTETGMLGLLGNALSMVKDHKVKNQLQQMADARMPGNPVYPFSFQDTTGKFTSLSDLKGKVVLMDSWYKGCINCSVLKKQMDTVIRHFKDRPDLVFLSLNVDRDKNRFIDGVKSGYYTAPESLNLYTNGLGHEHPMLTYYQYNGYPNLLLIDKKGKLISANPPRPADPERTGALIDLISRHL